MYQISSLKLSLGCGLMIALYILLLLLPTNRFDNCKKLNVSSRLYKLHLLGEYAPLI